MAKKLNSMPDYRANMPRQPHDLSQSTAFTCCPGSLNPVYFDMLHTGDEIFFSASQFTRLNPMTCQALGQIDVHLDYFFVPLTVMYTPSSSMFYQTEDLLSSNFDNREDAEWEFFPVTDLKAYLATLKGHLSDGAHYQINNVLPINAFDGLGLSVSRLIDFFDLSLHSALSLFASGSAVGSTYPDFTPWFPCAYQAIYQLYFRNDDREGKNYHYNMDKYYDVGSFQEDRTKKSIFELNYASRPKDYFNSVKVNPIGSSVSTLSGPALSSLYGHVNDWLSDGGSLLGDNTGNVGPDFGDSTAVQTIGTNSGGYNFIGSNQIRQLFMVDKLLRVVGRAEKNYESQFLAHYGIKIPHDVMHNITHIGHDMFTMNPEAILSTADTYNSSAGTGSALGEVGGQCSGMLSGTKKSFKAPFHGVFMCISHIVPRRRYVLGLNKLHMLTSPNNFWQPEFDRKGMEPIFSFEASYYGDESMSNTLGWQFAYEMFKRKSDRVLGAFEPSQNTHYLVNTLSPWVISSCPYGYIKPDGSNVYSPEEAGGVTNIHVYDLLVSPNDLNVNMIVPHNTSFPSADASGQYHPWQLYATDPFICDFNMRCKKVNMMSEYGEPEL